MAMFQVYLRRVAQSYVAVAMLLLLGLIGGANSTMLVSSINNLLNLLQVNSNLLFTSHDTIA